MGKDERMASVRKNVTRGGETTWSVLYRDRGRQRSKTFHDRKYAEKLARLIDDLGPEDALSLMTSRQAAGPTLREIARQWLEHKRRDLTPRAHADYTRDYDNWVDPFLGHLPAASITEGDVQNWVDRNLAPRLSAKTVADRHALLHGIYKWAAARKRDLVPHNPCLETDLPKRTKTPPKGLTMGEWLALRDAAYQVDADAADLILFLASTGWRIGEATALMVRGVEDTDDGVFVTMTQVNRKGSGVVAGAKSQAGYRRLRVSSECAAMLRRRVVGKGSADYVFTNPHSPTGLWEPSTFRNRWWAKSVKKAGLKDRAPTPHWLRHTHVMLCHAAGMSLPEIQRRLGHEDIKTTINTYGRMIDDMSSDVADRLDALLTGRVPVAVEAKIVRGELEG